MYYHPGLILKDEQVLSNIYFAQSAAHDKLEGATKLAMFGAYFPALYYLSKSVRPYGCGFFTLGYLATYSYAVKPFLLSQFQKTLNKSALPFKDKYGIKMDSDYMPADK